VSFTISNGNPDDTLVEQGRAQHISRDEVGGRFSGMRVESHHGFTGSKGSHMRELFLLDGDDADDAGWQERALCAQTDPEAFFPEKGGSTREAKKVCLTCDVRTECLESALMNDERFGIWGGLSERERRRLKRGIG
jgi:WhiB family transcriptional regulator, redox-sensing transcriptional regulator